MLSDLPRPIAVTIDALQSVIRNASQARPASGPAGRLLARLLTLVEASPPIEAAAARLLAACSDLDDEIEAVRHCRVPPLHSVDSARAAAVFSLGELIEVAQRAAPSGEAYHEGLAWARRRQQGTAPG